MKEAIYLNKDLKHFSLLWRPKKRKNGTIQSGLFARTWTVDDPLCGVLLHARQNFSSNSSLFGFPKQGHRRTERENDGRNALVIM